MGVIQCNKMQEGCTAGAALIEILPLRAGIVVRGRHSKSTVTDTRMILDMPGAIVIPVITGCRDNWNVANLLENVICKLGTIYMGGKVRFHELCPLAILVVGLVGMCEEEKRSATATISKLYDCAQCNMTDSGWIRMLRRSYNVGINRDGSIYFIGSEMGLSMIEGIQKLLRTSTKTAIHVARRMVLNKTVPAAAIMTNRGWRWNPYGQQQDPRIEDLFVPNRHIPAW